VASRLRDRSRVDPFVFSPVVDPIIAVDVVDVVRPGIFFNPGVIEAGALKIRSRSTVTVYVLRSD
jgi:hypothetical protein